MLYSIDLPAKGQFEDPDFADRADGKLKYKITSSRDDVFIQDGSPCTTTATTATCKVWVDIAARRPMVNEFNLNVMAEDSDMAPSPSVSFPIRMENPAKQTYNVQQFRESGDFRSIVVGYRAETEHALVFKHPDESVTTAANRLRGFLFAEELINDLNVSAALPDPVILMVAEPDVPKGYPVAADAEDVVEALYGVSAPPALAVHTVTGGVEAQDGDAADGSISVYTVETTGRVSVAAMTKEPAGPALVLETFETAADDASDTDIATDATLAFTVTGVGTGTIEIGYHVWWDEDGPQMPGDTAEDPATGTKKAKWHFAKETLKVTVVAVD